jgi:hypothetical protein
VCASYSITPHNAGEHFAYRPPEHPLRLNDSSRTVGNWKDPGRPMNYTRTEQTTRLEQPVKELNIARRSGRDVRDNLDETLRAQS